MATPLKFSGDEAALIRAVRAGHPGAARALYDGYAGSVHAALQRIVGADPDLPDLLQDVFILAVGRLQHVREPNRLRSWLIGLAVRTARQYLRRRARRRRLSLFAPWRTASHETRPPEPEAMEAMQQIYEVLDEMPVEERIVFALRFIAGMGLEQGAEAAGISLATFKRRLVRAERSFVAASASRPAVSEWMKGGSRWRAIN